jgi:GST-like protein
VALPPAQVPFLLQAEKPNVHGCDGGWRRMIDVYSWPTSNGRKIHIMLEETGLPYAAHPVNIDRREQFKPEFLKISPNNKIPAIVDRDGPGGKPLSIFESGAILIYLAHKSGQFLPQDEAKQCNVLQWLFMQVGSVGPNFGQANHFRAKPQERGEYAVNRFTKECTRILGVLDRRLGEAEYLADDYSIADIATFPWLQSTDKQGQDLADFPNVSRWFNVIQARPGVQRGVKVMREIREKMRIEDAARKAASKNSKDL